MRHGLVEPMLAGELVSVKVKVVKDNGAGLDHRRHDITARCPFCGMLNRGLFTKDFSPCSHFLFTEPGSCIGCPYEEPKCNRPEELDPFAVGKGKKCDRNSSVVFYSEDGALTPAENPAGELEDTVTVRMHFAPNLLRRTYHWGEVLPDGGLLEEILSTGEFPWLPAGPFFRTLSVINLRGKPHFALRLSCRSIRAGKGDSQ
jgi:hypothetical protein